MKNQQTATESAFFDAVYYKVLKSMQARLAAKEAMRAAEKEAMQIKKAAELEAM
jgi:hypothetical protein